MTRPLTILRVFPRRTNATPDDDMVIIGDPPLFRPEATEVHISVAFTYDRPFAEHLKKSYEEFYDWVEIGGPGMGDPGGDLTPGRYLEPGYVITSRGCPNKCWFCDVWRRGGNIRELPITEGWNVLDDNLLACSDKHMAGVFDMLHRHPHRPAFTGGLEARRITREIAAELKRLNPKPIYTTFDRMEIVDDLYRAGHELMDVGFNYEIMRCFVLIGYPGDDLVLAQHRLSTAWAAGFMPFAMLYRDEKGDRNPLWIHFAKIWSRPASVKAICQNETR